MEHKGYGTKVEMTNSIGFSKTELGSSRVFYEGRAHELLNSNDSNDAC